MISSRDQEAQRRAARSLRRRTIARAIFRWTFPPVLAFILIIVGSMEIGPAIKAAMNRGVDGFFVAETEYCTSGRGGQTCDWKGNFVLPDGTVRWRNINFADSTNEMYVGEQVPAVDTGGPDEVFARGSGQWLINVAELLGGTAILCGWIVVVPVRETRRRRARSAYPI